MTKIEKYVCEFCGKEFDNEAECRKHELQEQFTRTYQSTVLFDYRLNKISVKDVLEHLVVIEAFQIFEKDEIPLVKNYLKKQVFVLRGTMTAGNFRKELDFMFGIMNITDGLFLQK